MRRLWAVDGTGSYRGGLTALLLEQGEAVAEIDRPTRPARRNGAKSDGLDAIRAAREALARDHLSQPRRRGDREAMRVLLATRASAGRARTKALCHLRALVVNAPERLRSQLQVLATGAFLDRCAHMRQMANSSAESRCTRLALRATARRIRALEGEAAELEAQLALLVKQHAPLLLAEFAVGTIAAAQILCSWSDAGRIRSEAAFAALAGLAPIEASSGQVHRHRLNRCGDRQLNRAIHLIVIGRLGSPPRNSGLRAPADRRRQEPPRDPALQTSPGSPLVQAPRSRIRLATPRPHTHRPEPRTSS
jgi:transposase